MTVADDTTGPPRRAPGWRRWLLPPLQLAIVGLVLWRAAVELGGQWNDVRARSSALHPEWARVALSIALVLATYALLIHAWRTLVSAWGSRLGFGDAVRIWAVSNLGRYVPGKLWSIAAMGLLARRVGVSPAAASGSAIIGTLVNIAAGFAVVLFAGARVLPSLVPGRERTATTVAIVVTAGLLLLPFVVGPLATWVARRLGRGTVTVALPARVLWFVVGANLLAWVGYGAAFRIFADALAPGSAGNWLDYLAVFTGSYLAGYLVLIAPGGIGVRELAMAESLKALGLAGPGEAWLLAFASRLWLTVLEVAPGLYFLARDAARRTPTTRPDVTS
jgi:hypothetical protein